ncbi:MAG: M23 family metallopeptidase [Candidatus Woesearchaeota archaeon]|jgi:murein DD-endopeptidase MepM/ murein hydrolase activator NlpD
MSNFLKWLSGLFRTNPLNEVIKESEELSKYITRKDNIYNSKTVSEDLKIILMQIIEKQRKIFPKISQLYKAKDETSKKEIMDRIENYLKILEDQEFGIKNNDNKFFKAALDAEKAFFNLIENTSDKKITKTSFYSRIYNLKERLNRGVVTALFLFVIANTTASTTFISNIIPEQNKTSSVLINDAEKQNQSNIVKEDTTTISTIDSSSIINTNEKGTIVLEEKKPIFSEFGKNRGTQIHPGIDVWSKESKVFPLFNNEKVIELKNDYIKDSLDTRGNFVVTERLDDSGNGMGIYYEYEHLQAVFVRRGQNLTKNTQLGIMGNTGATEGRIHTHIEKQIIVNPSKEIMDEYFKAKRNGKTNIRCEINGQKGILGRKTINGERVYVLRLNPIENINIAYTYNTEDKSTKIAQIDKNNTVRQD